MIGRSRKRAYCAELEQRNPHIADLLWHPAPDNARRSKRVAALAANICRSCPLRLECLAQAVACSYDDDAIYGGLSRRDRHRLGAMIDKDVIVRRRDGADVDRRRRECLEWLRAHPSALAQLDDSTRYWSREWATRKRDMAVARN